MGCGCRHRVLPGPAPDQPEQPAAVDNDMQVAKYVRRVGTVTHECIISRVSQIKTHAHVLEQIVAPSTKNATHEHGQPNKLMVVLGRATKGMFGPRGPRLGFGPRGEDSSSFRCKGLPLAHLLWYGLSR